jgi:hypothetical protein
VTTQVVLIHQRNRWSQAIQSWVDSFRGRELDKSVPMFDTLLKDKAPNPESPNENGSQTLLPGDQEGTQD